MGNNKFAFIILHYLTIEDTKTCVDSIVEKYGSNENVYIVIVDNFSPNGSGKILEKEYSEYERINVILAKKNLGFANGNNLGFKFAKDKLKADFIIMINNDTYITQKNFLEKILDEYDNSNFAVLGPKIILKDNKINGIYKDLQSIKHYEKDLGIMKYEYILSYIYLYPIYKFFRRTIRKLFILLRIKKSDIGIDPNVRYENIILHGCALIFSKKYINKFDGLDDRTFLYREEELLYLRLKKSNLKNIYNPDIEIFHNEDGSTDALAGSKRKKRLFVGKNLINSTLLLIDELKKDK